ncbi:MULTISPECIES: hypothetical protein [unclassified Streptomyces]|uniref:hypothetical protein n=1 Tax=unclassified Streptomyces TaxID=2593676 RepID=UPI002E2BC30D|nr:MULTISPECIES: hypothetical protein [unclassified Streptomyces]WUB88379.1 hypothetical protein OG812_18060 [Streptomyces sp. NBC_00566]
MRIQSRFAQVLAVAALPLALAACSPSSSDSGASSKEPKAKNLNAGLMTGTQLKKALAPASFFPSHLSALSDGFSDSGDQFASPASRDTAKPDCTKFENTTWLDASGFKGGVSFAQGEYANKDETEEMVQEIDVFQGTTANAVMQQIRAAAGACATFTDLNDHSKVKLAGTTTSGLGDDAYTMTLTSGHWENGTTLVAARVGNAVVTVTSSTGKDNGAANATKLAGHLVDSLKAASAKG